MKKEIKLSNKIKEIKLSNKIFVAFLGTVFCSLILVLLCVICIVVTCVFEEARDLKNVLSIGSVAIVSFWVIFCVIVIFSKQAIITSEEIKLVRQKKVCWVIKRTDVAECIYQEVKWWNFIFPMSSINMSSLQFKLTNGTISRKYLSLSKKQVKKIQENFDYPIRIINSIHKQ